MTTRFSLLLSMVVMALLISACGGGASASQASPTASQVLNSYCNAFAKGDYQTAYKLLADGLPSQLGFKSEADFATAVKGTTCKVNSVNDSAGTGTITYTFTDGSISLDDETIQNGQIVKQAQRSTPTVTLTNFCAALKAGDYHTAYDQFSTKMQGQLGTVDQYIASLGSAKVTDCTVSNVNDSAGTGTIALTTSDGSTGTFDETLVNQNGTWKIDSVQAQATPTP
jgi:limonene-1,2-epoxide hydrolase